MIVGRRPELDRLQHLREQAGRGRTETVLIAGEAGMGKTTTIEAFLDAAAIADPSLQVVRGECVPLGGDGLPYAPIVGVVGELAARFGEAELIKWAGAGAAELGWMVPGLLPDRPEPDTKRVDGTQPETRIRLYETITRLLEEAGRRGPLVMVIEDLHWADDSTRHLSSYLLRVLTDAPLLMIFSYRSDELTRRHPLRPFLAEVTRLPTVHRMEIGPLAETPLAEMIDQVATDADPVLTRTIMSSSGGVPYFAIELARASAGDGELPDTLRDTLLLRVSRVSEECQQMLRRLSIGGTRVDHELLAAVHDLGETELEAVLREAVEANLLVTDGTGYAFRHALMREAVHNDLLPGEHARLHRLFGTVLQERPELLPPAVRTVELAHHWYAARDNERAFRWSIEAARSQLYGFAEALQHYERALELWDAVSDPQALAGQQTDVLDEAAAAARNAGEAERALALINESVRLTDRSVEPYAAAQRLANRSRMLHNQMQPGVLDTINEAVALVPEHPPSALRADVLSRRASLTMLLDKAASVDLAREAIDAANAAGATTPLAHARITLGTALVGLGLDVEHGLAEFAAARSVIDDHPDPVLGCDESPLVRYHINYSDALTALGRYRDALDVAVEGRELSARFGLERRSGVMLAGNAAEAAIALGRWSRARELVEWGQRMTPPGNHWVHQRLLLAELVIWADDDLDRAEQILADMDRFARVDANGPDYIAQARRTKAALAWARDDWPQAWELARQLREDVPWWEPTHDMMALGYAAMAYAGESDPPPDWAQELRAGLQRPADSLIGRHWRPLIEAVLEGSVAGWETAIATMIDAEAPQLNISYARLQLAGALVHDHRPDDAALVAAQVRADAEQMGLRLLRRRLDTFVRESGLGAATGGGIGRTQPPEPDGLPELTAREREVLALVADGLSNRQIGERLVISAKTASVHVSNILAKLDVSSRGAAAALYRDAES